MNASARECVRCGVVFTPKPQGFNARYCSKRCKSRVRHPVYDSVKRQRAYRATQTSSISMAKHRFASRKYRQQGREWLAEYKLTCGCADCGFNTHAAALQLDHEGLKTVAISEARSSIARLKAEIESGQCVVRCANCHAIKTVERRQNDRS